MQDEGNFDQEPEVSELSESTESAKNKGRRSVARMRRELTEEELSSPGVKKFLMDEIDRLEEENRLLSQFKSRYHAADKLVAILKERASVRVTFEILSNGSLAVGALLLGYLPQIWELQPLGWILLALGVVLVASSIITKVKVR